MNWRHEIKSWFADQLHAAIGEDLNLWGAWNSQTDNTTEETFGEFAVFFEYSEIDAGFEYLKQRDFQRADRTPVNVTLHFVFNNQSTQHQDLAYEYANAIIQKVAGLKHPLIVGQFVKVSEIEDVSHEVQYEYQITFAMQVKEYYYSEIETEDANPIDSNGNPLTGRRIRFDIVPTIDN